MLDDDFEDNYEVVAKEHKILEAVKILVAKSDSMIRLTNINLTPNKKSTSKLKSMNVDSSEQNNYKYQLQTEKKKQYYELVVDPLG